MKSQKCLLSLVVILQLSIVSFSQGQGNGLQNNPNLNITMPSQEGCGQVVLNAGCDYDCIQWDDQNNTTTQELVVTTSGTYVAEVGYDEDGDGTCDFSYFKEFEVIVNTLPQPVLVDAIICSGETLTLDPGTFDSYQWSDGSTNPTLDVTAPGQYCVTVTDVNGCQKDTCMNLTNYTALQVDLGDDFEGCQGVEHTLDAGPGYSSYLWSTGETTQTIIVTDPDLYSVEVTDANGCSASDEIAFLQSDLCVGLRSTNCDQVYTGTTYKFIKVSNSVPVAVAYLWEFTTTYNGNTYTHYYTRNNASYFYAAYVGAATDGSVTNGIYTPGVQQGQATGLIYYTTYEVRVRAVLSFAADGVTPHEVGPVGHTCTLRFDDPSTTLNGHCGNTTPYTNTSIFIKYDTEVGGAFEYNYIFTNTSNTSDVRTYLKPNPSSPPYFYAKYVPLDYQTTWEVDVEAHILDYDSNIQNSLPQPCAITFGDAVSVPKNVNCPATLSFDTDYLAPTRLGSATGYKWFFDDGNGNIFNYDQHGQNPAGFKPQWVPGLQPNETYEVWIQGYTDLNLNTPVDSLLPLDNPVKCEMTFTAAAQLMVDPDNDEKILSSEEDIAGIKSKGLTFKVFPNPASDQVTIELPFNVGQALIVVTDINGKVVQEGVFSETKFSLQVDQLPKGLYNLTITNGDLVETKPIIIK